jgi:hypothetical protein
MMIRESFLIFHLLKLNHSICILSWTISRRSSIFEKSFKQQFDGSDDSEVADAEKKIKMKQAAHKCH